MKLLTIIGLAVFLVYGCDLPDEQVPTVDTEIDFNDDWEFARDIDEHLTDEFFSRSGDTFQEWEEVRLPHTAYVEPLVIDDQQWQGTAVYRKTFHADQAHSESHVALRFGAAMHEAEVYLNGEHIHANQGGYLPFVIDLSDKLNYGEDNTLLLTVNNEDNPQIPPGKPIEELDFNWYSGLYRNVTLHVKDPLHIADPILAGREAGGGLRVHYEEVSEEDAQVHVQADIQNEDAAARQAEVRFVLQDDAGQIIAEETAETEEIPSGEYEWITTRLDVANPELWSPDHPYLYDLTVQVMEEGELVDSETERIGIRSISIDRQEGFVLNGEPLKLRGTNRHQDYPYIGYALSDNAQYRDAYKIKEAGYNFIRIGHYPPSPAFLEAADELGLLFMNAIPGWQFFGDETFQENAWQDVREMVRRDRNHPSIAVWEASLNETEMTEEFMEEAHEIVNRELPEGDVYTSGWMDHAYDIYIPARQHSRPPEYWSEYDGERPLFIAEYGDWEYYAHNAGFNQDDFEDLQEEERNSRQLRGFGQERLAQQALNFQEAHNSNLYSPMIGDANWAMNDYNRGYADNICACGIRDIFRIPKFTNYFYQSQATPDPDDPSEFREPMAYIANYWSDPEFNDVKVYSNAEEVALYLNDELIETRRPDEDRVSSNLEHPPFTFEDVEFEPGALRAEARIGEETVATHRRVTATEPAAVELDVDLSNRRLEAGSNDVVFVYASVVDENGNTNFEAGPEVSFTVEGDAELIGHNPIEAEAGIATILLRAGAQPGEILIRAESETLEPAELTVTAY